jgi:hypothetical protein
MISDRNTTTCPGVSRHQSSGAARGYGLPAVPVRYHFLSEGRQEFFCLYSSMRLCQNLPRQMSSAVARGNSFNFRRSLSMQPIHGAPVRTIETFMAPLIFARGATQPASARLDNSPRASVIFRKMFRLSLRQCGSPQVVPQTVLGRPRRAADRGAPDPQSRTSSIGSHDICLCFVHATLIAVWAPFF